MVFSKIKIQHESLGVIVEQSFSDKIQFKLFLKMVNACLETKTNLDFFNGIDFLIHIPYKHLVDSMIVTNTEEYSISEHFIQKNKIES
jgi:hypothetical protein